MEKMLTELAIFSVYYRDPVTYANKAYEKVKSRKEAGEITPDEAEALLDVVFRHLWEVL